MRTGHLSRFRLLATAMKPAGTRPLLVKVARTPDHAAELDSVLDKAFAVARRRLQDQADHLRGGGHEVLASEVGHEGGQAEHLLRVAGRQRLHDEAAHGGAHHVGGCDLERVQDGGRVVGHVVDGVGGRDLPGENLGRIRHAQMVQACGEADVPVVVAHHVEAAVGEHQAERLWPGRHLGAQAHDQEQRRVGVVAKRLVFELQPVRLDLRHQQLSPNVIETFTPRRACAASMASCIRSTG